MGWLQLSKQELRRVEVLTEVLAGKARAKSLTKARRSEIARKAAEARWSKKKKIPER